MTIFKVKNGFRKYFAQSRHFPAIKDDIGEAVVQLQLKKLPVEQAAELRKNLIGGGYNPDEPKVDSRFLEWMRRSR
jgi:hypothetical protein